MSRPLLIRYYHKLLLHNEMEMGREVICLRARRPGPRNRGRSGQHDIGRVDRVEPQPAVMELGKPAVGECRPASHPVCEATAG